MVGLTRQQIWNISEHIPGMVKVGKQRRFDPKNPDFKKWVKERKGLAKGVKTHPRLRHLLYKLQSGILHCDSLFLTDREFIVSIARVVGHAYGRLLDSNPTCAHDLIRAIGTQTDERARQKKREKVSRTLITQDDNPCPSGPRMNGKRFSDI